VEGSSPNSLALYDTFKRKKISGIEEFAIEEPIACASVSEARNIIVVVTISSKIVMAELTDRKWKTVKKVDETPLEASEIVRIRHNNKTDGQNKLTDREVLFFCDNGKTPTMTITQHVEPEDVEKKRKDRPLQGGFASSAPIPGNRLTDTSIMRGYSESTRN
jgi:hypothetical protein